jgi:hypothetical protein
MYTARQQYEYKYSTSTTPYLTQPQPLVPTPTETCLNGALINIPLKLEDAVHVLALPSPLNETPLVRHDGFGFGFVSDELAMARDQLGP